MRPPLKCYLNDTMQLIKMAGLPMSCAEYSVSFRAGAAGGAWELSPRGDRIIVIAARVVLTVLIATCSGNGNRLQYRS